MGRNVMGAGEDEVRVVLQRPAFGEREKDAVAAKGLTASLFRYPTGVDAIRLSTARGDVVVLPYMGQMVWSAMFDGVPLQMQSMFPAPRPAKTIVETYGCLAYHAGLLRNGVPAEGDNHAVHGEAPCAEMDEAGIAYGADGRGPWMAVTGARRYTMGFGANYLSTPRVILRPGATGFDIVMEVENLSAAPMDLMYLCHVNFAFAPGARIVQSVPFTPEHVVARTAIPAHVVATPEYEAQIKVFAAHPERSRVLGTEERYDPEQVFYVKGLKRGADGLIHFMLLRPEGDAFAIAWDPESMPHAIRWILDNKDQRVAAFAMPGTCEPEGYTAEKRKGNVRSLASGAKARFVTQVGYVDKDQAAAEVAGIEGHQP
jgi:Domain of unknown function (DUF4432)